MTETIVKKLHEIEQANNIRIIYAVESGSRAWGFASPDSDYDVRYIYVRTAEDYLTVDERRDTIEGPLDDVLDFSGWDVRKALALLRKTNPSLMEWINSPIVYLRTKEWDLFEAAAPACFDVQANLHHYLSMSLRNSNLYLKRDQVSIKKYLYVLRPILCGRWLEQYSAMPPVLFSDLCEKVLPDKLKPATDELLLLKKQALEADLIGHIPVLDEFIFSEQERLNAVMHAMPRKHMQEFDGLNALFRAILRGAWDKDTFV
ncbi:MAG: nucleotidyltransferase domain-containing protein [Clostridia bacterium]|nr:nucleotidyltransferase domain-containing protein [Clostridia bacterium]